MTDKEKLKIIENICRDAFNSPKTYDVALYRAQALARIFHIFEYGDAVEGLFKGDITIKGEDLMTYFFRKELKKNSYIYSMPIQDVENLALTILSCEKCDYWLAGWNVEDQTCPKCGGRMNEY